MSNYRYTAAKDALSFLRAAEVNQGDVEDSDLAQAFNSLKRYTERIEQAEREALDDKVRAYLNRVLLNKVGDMYRITDHDRDEYARAAEFFQVGKPEPRVLDHCDPEPARDTKWRDKQWDVWSHNGTGWTISEDSAGSLWPGKHTMGKHYFPMTEVTE